MVSRVRSPSFIGSFVVVVVGASLVLACSSSTDNGSSSGSSGSGSGSSGSSGGVADASADRRLPGPVRPAASCPVVIETPEVLASPHVDDGTVIAYNSNPPSSGPHYGAWANFQEFTRPLDEGFLVHSLEHGAVALLHKCDPAAADCAPIIEALRKVRDAIPTDPSCSGGLRVRVIIAPFPKLDTPVGAAAWGFTYKGDCVDAPTLTQFINDNYAKAPENFCFPGSIL